jgi:hypothetical protein
MEIGECYDDSDFNETVAINGSTSDATRYMHLTVASGQRHPGTFVSGVVIARSVAADPILSINDPFTRVEWLLITKTITTGIASGIGIADNNVLIDHCIIYGMTTTNAGQVQKGIKIIGATARTNCVVRNTMVISITTNTGEATGIRIEDTGAHTLTLMNNTVYDIENSGAGTAYGIHVNNASAVVTATNNAVFASETADYQATAGTLTQSFNAASDATADGTGSLDSQTAANQFVSLTGGSEDLHLKTGANLIDAGTNTGAPSDDIDGNSRPQNGTTDIGADEFLSAAPAAGKKKSLPIWFQ